MPLRVNKDKLDKIVKNLRTLSRHEVYIGVPAKNSPRLGGDAMTNASLAYIHEYGSPAANIPARPFLHPAMEQMTERIVERMKIAGVEALKGNMGEVYNQFDAVGMEVSTRAKDIISAGIPPPLAESTIRGRKGPGPFTALIDTGQMQNSISYVVIIR